MRAAGLVVLLGQFAHDNGDRQLFAGTNDRHRNTGADPCGRRDPLQIVGSADLLVTESDDHISGPEAGELGVVWVIVGAGGASSSWT